MTDENDDKEGVEITPPGTDFQLTGYAPLVEVVPVSAAASAIVSGVQSTNLTETDKALVLSVIADESRHLEDAAKILGGLSEPQLVAIRDSTPEATGILQSNNIAISKESSGSLAGYVLKRRETVSTQTHNWKITARAVVLTAVLAFLVSKF